MPSNRTWANRGHFCLLINQLPRLIPGKIGASDLDLSENFGSIAENGEQDGFTDQACHWEKWQTTGSHSEYGWLSQQGPVRVGLCCKMKSDHHPQTLCYLCCVELGKGKRSSQTCFPQDCLQKWQPNHTCSHSWRFSKFQSSMDLLSSMCWNQRRWWSKQIA